MSTQRRRDHPYRQTRWCALVVVRRPRSYSVVSLVWALGCVGLIAAAVPTALAWSRRIGMLDPSGPARSPRAGARALPSRRRAEVCPARAVARAPAPKGAGVRAEAPRSAPAPAARSSHGRAASEDHAARSPDRRARAYALEPGDRLRGRWSSRPHYCGGRRVVTHLARVTPAEARELSRSLGRGKVVPAVSRGFPAGLKFYRLHRAFRRAGMRPGDRVWRVNGMSLVRRDPFAAVGPVINLLARHGGALVLDACRGGTLHHFVIEGLVP